MSGGQRPARYTHTHTHTHSHSYTITHIYSHRHTYTYSQYTLTCTHTQHTPTRKHIEHTRASTITKERGPGPEAQPPPAPPSSVFSSAASQDGEAQRTHAGRTWPAGSGHQPTVPAVALEAHSRAQSPRPGAAAQPLRDVRGPKSTDTAMDRVGPARPSAQQSSITPSVGDRGF